MSAQWKPLGAQVKRKTLDKTTDDGTAAVRPLGLTGVELAVAVTYLGVGVIVASLVSVYAVNDVGRFSKRASWVLSGLGLVALVSALPDLLLVGGSPSLVFMHLAAVMGFVGPIAALLALGHRAGRLPEAQSPLQPVGWSLLVLGIALVAGSAGWAYFG